MITAVEIVNVMASVFVHVVVWPVRALAPVWALLLLSVISGMLALAVFGLVSNQTAIRTIRDRIRGNVIGIRLFGDDLRVLFRFQAKILRDTVVYIGYALFPTVILVIPFLPILAQTNLLFSSRPLRVGEPTVVTARAAGPQVDLARLTLQGSEGVEVLGPGVRVPELGEVSWRVRPVQGGRHLLTVRAGEEELIAHVVAGSRWQAVPVVRTASTLDLLLYPGEPALPADGPIQRIEVAYPNLPVTIFGFEIHWLIVLFVGMIASAFALRGVFGVEI